MLPETNWGIGFRRRGAWAWAPVRVIVGGGSKWFLRDDSLINFYLGVFLAVGVIFWGGWELGAGGGLCRRGVFFGFVVGGGGVLGLSGLCVCVCVCGWVGVCVGACVWAWGLWDVSKFESSAGARVAFGGLSCW